MHITAVCPQCKSRYQVDQALKGRRMRCPNQQCRAVFDVVDSTDAAPGASNTGGAVGSPTPVPPPEPARPNHVSNFVPVEKAEVAGGANFADWRSGPPARGAAAPAPPAQKQPPPAAKQPTAPPPARKDPPPAPAAQTPTPSGPVVADWRAAAPPPAVPGQPRPAPAPPPPSPKESPRPAPVEMPAGSWEVPPVREAANEVIVDAAPVGEEDPDIAAGKAKARRARRLMIGMVAGLVLVLGIGGVIAWILIAGGEDRLYANANEKYDEERFGEAAKLFRTLVDKHPNSIRKAECQFMIALCNLRGAAGDSELDIAHALTLFDAFLKEQANATEFLKQRSRDVGETLFKKVSDYLDKVKDSEDPKVKPVLDQIQTTLVSVLKSMPESVTQEERTKIDALIAEARRNLELALKRRELLDQFKTQFRVKKGADGIREARKFLRQAAKIVKELDRHEEAIQGLSEMENAHLAGVKYVAANVNDSPAPGRRVDDTEPSVLLDPEMVKSALKPSGSAVMALCRGVLYVLDASTGQIRWAMRVGIDTTHLPIRLPATQTNTTERLVVVSADTRTLASYDIDGRRLWQYHLGAKCVGRPLILNGRIYLPTVDGKLHEVKLNDGKPVGWFELGQRLSTGAVHQKGTGLIYVPGDDTCVYVLDVTPGEERKCSTILYTNHQAGLLRGEPVIINNHEANSPERGTTPHLLLALASGIHETELKVYELPVTDRHAPPVALESKPRLRGWTWFTPHVDSEKVVCLSDAARLGLFGIKQMHNNDPILFPMISEQQGAQKSESGIDLSAYLRVESEGRRGRAMVAHVQGDDMLVLGQGKLQRLEIRLNRLEGPRPVARWKSPLDLGVPLLPEQVREGPEGTSVILVTQPVGRPECIVTAIDPDATDRALVAGDPRIRWQRQLGMVCHGEPLTVGDELLAMDRAGGFFRFRPAEFKGTERWQVGGKVVAAGLESGEPPQLIRVGPKTVYAVSSPAGTRLLIRRYDAGEAGKEPTVGDMQEVELPARLAGSVALVGQTLVVPLDSGRLARYPLPIRGRPMPDEGPTWRAPLAGLNARCQIVLAGDDEFLTTDGSRTLTRWEWKPGGQFRQIAKGELPDRLAGTPLVLSTKPLKVVVTDRLGRVTVLGENLNGDPGWTLKGRITAGPFLRGSHIGCVVENTRLVWLDPMKEGDPAWEYRTSGEAIVGEPLLMGDMIVVADEGGKYIGLDPKSGRSRGEGYQLKALVAPATTPVPFGPNRAFAPLTDGTIMLLSLDRLTGK